MLCNPSRIFLSNETEKDYTSFNYRYMAFLGPSVTLKLFSAVSKVVLALSFWATPSRVISCLQDPMWLSETLCLPVKLCTFSPRVPQIPSGPANYSPNLLIMWQVLWLELGSEVCVSRAGLLTSTVTPGTHPSAGAWVDREGPLWKVRLPDRPPHGHTVLAMNTITYQNKVWPASTHRAVWNWKLLYR